MLTALTLIVVVTLFTQCISINIGNIMRRTDKVTSRNGSRHLSFQNTNKLGYQVEQQLERTRLNDCVLHKITNYGLAY